MRAINIFSLDSYLLFGGKKPPHINHDLCVCKVQSYTWTGQVARGIQHAAKSYAHSLDLIARGAHGRAILTRWRRRRPLISGAALPAFRCAPASACPMVHHAGRFRFTFAFFDVEVIFVARALAEMKKRENARKREKKAFKWDNWFMSNSRFLFVISVHR